ncbi:hypothetical protein [Silvanigrella aquatica]|uniref:Uncharacterized protein n=1 Tax=Silvanigrella aquatica TaxID=1915309 RepID=A0A1L4D0T2_9BACT|nr:hypothetical protein [Silvanigrella aquatica]APJ03809.1 hypothetical protein AXG55_07785 [Silvanigrella aquatica]
MLPRENNLIILGSDENHLKSLITYDSKTKIFKTLYSDKNLSITNFSVSLNGLITFFTLTSCKTKLIKSMEEAQERINDSQLAYQVYPERNNSEFQQGDIIYFDISEDSMNNHKSFFNYNYAVSPQILENEEIKGLSPSNMCQDLFGKNAKNKCFEVVENFEYTYKISGDFQHIEKPFSRASKGQRTVETEVRTFQGIVKFFN